MKILKSGGRESFNSLPLHVNWHITNRCNYRCSYCFHYGTGKTPPVQEELVTLQQMKTAVNNIMSLNRPWYNITFGGGEPTVHPHLFDVISLLYENLGDRLSWITIVSNGSRNIDLYKKIADTSEKINFKMQISIHTDHVDMSHILDLIKNLSANIDMGFSLMFNPDKRKFVHEIYDMMFEQRKKSWFKMNIVTLRDGDIVDPRYTPEDFAWQKKAVKQFNDLAKSLQAQFPARRKIKFSNPVIRDIEDNGQIKKVQQGNRTLELAEGLLRFKGMYCIAHASVLRISANGSCLGMVCSDDRRICNIFKENCFKPILDKLIHSVKCTKLNCGCSANDIIPKFASEEEAKKFVSFAQKRQAELFSEYNAAHAIKTI